MVSGSISVETDSDDVNTINTTPDPSSLNSSPTLDAVEDIPDVASGQKKKKKKKPKKSAKAKEAAAKAKAADASADGGRPNVLCISRNKHWRYISSYHGPWLQLPIELLESLLILNIDPAMLSASEPRLPPIPNTSSGPSLYPSGSKQQRDRGGFQSIGNDFSPPESPHTTLASLALPPPLPIPKPGKAIPPPIDPGVFRSVTSIRRLIDEAAELSVRASSGLTSAELGSMRGMGLGGSPWAAAQTLGINPLANPASNGRNVAMSAMRIHRLRALAVQKLAQAYKADEIASSVMVMQGGSVFDDVAERVLKTDPNDVDAKYVHFFHEKIPSRQLAESTTTQVLDELIRAQPQRLEFYRTRGIVHCFRDEYPQAIRDFTHAIKEARAVRKARIGHSGDKPMSDSRKKKRKGGSARANGQAPANGTSAVDNEAADGGPEPMLLLHPSVLPDAPDPIEPQCFFLRGSAYLQQAIYMIENAVLELEGVRKAPTIDGAELRLSYIENGKYGGVEIGNPEGPLGRKEGAKVRAYRNVLATQTFKEHIAGMLRKSIRDHERFLSHFDTLESGEEHFEGDLAQQTEYAFLVSESIRPGSHQQAANGTSSASALPPLPDTLAMFTTYHPLLVESHFTILICQLMLGDFAGILPSFIRTASLVDGLEGYPVFLPPRSMAQAELIEVLERLASGWRNGIMPHSMSTSSRKKAKAIEAPPPPSLSPSPPRTPSPPPETASSSSSTCRTPADGSSTNGKTTPDGYTPVTPRDDAFEALDCARILLAPVAKRQRERAERAAAEKAGGGGKKKPLSINIPLHGPRVEVILAWLGAVHLPELDL